MFRALLFLWRLIVKTWLQTSIKNVAELFRFLFNKSIIYMGRKRELIPDLTIQIGNLLGWLSYASGNLRSRFCKVCLSLVMRHALDHPLSRVADNFEHVLNPKHTSYRVRAIYE